jgi:hypothetical protein
MHAAHRATPRHADLQTRKSDSSGWKGWSQVSHHLSAKGDMKLCCALLSRNNYHLGAGVEKRFQSCQMELIRKHLSRDKDQDQSAQGRSDTYSEDVTSHDNAFHDQGGVHLDDTVHKVLLCNLVFTVRNLLKHTGQHCLLVHLKGNKSW